MYICYQQLAMKDVGVARDKLTADETVKEREMTQMSGIFYMMYEAEKAGGYTIFNANGIFPLYFVCSVAAGGDTHLQQKLFFPPECICC